MQHWIIDQLCYCRGWVFLRNVSYGGNTENLWSKTLHWHTLLHYTDINCSINSDTVFTVYLIEKESEFLLLNTRMYWHVTRTATLLFVAVSKMWLTFENNVPSVETRCNSFKKYVGEEVGSIIYCWLFKTRANIYLRRGIYQSINRYLLWAYKEKNGLWQTSVSHFF